MKKSNSSLVILAAGLGTRFKGGIKQLTPVGANGELLIEYSVYDALRAGFEKVIFIIRKDIERSFKEMLGDRLAAYCDVHYCFQELDDIPEGFIVPEGRTKPWGTVQAVLSARKLIDGSFVIINADDYYGRTSYKLLYDSITAAGHPKNEQCMSGFVLENTLSENGNVTRGVCCCDGENMLRSVEETFELSKRSDGTVCGEQRGQKVTVAGTSIVSMNMWGCTTQVIPMLDAQFREFLTAAVKSGTAHSAELALPTAFDDMIKKQLINVRVLPTNERWYGMTRSEDLGDVKKAFAEMISKGNYPSPLFE